METLTAAEKGFYGLVQLPYRETNPQVQRGRPLLRGTRMPVDDIVSNYEAGVEPQEIAQLFELPLEQVKQVLAYATKVQRCESYFDKNVPVPSRRSLTRHTVRTAAEEGWGTLGNGALIAQAEKAGFDVHLNCDQNLQYQQNLTRRRLSLVVLGSNIWPPAQGLQAFSINRNWLVT